MADDLISIYIDDQEVKVPKGMNLVDAAASVGKEIPHYCYHPHLSVSGNCRMCLIELGMPGRDRATGQPMLDDQGNPKIQWIPKPVIACSTNAAPGMHVRTESKVVKECREGVMEFLLVNHPLDCPICDQAGECRLQEFATDYGRGYSRFIERKNVKPKRTRLGPRVMLDDERCILCSRCIRFSSEVAKDDVLGFVDRGSYSTLTCFPGKQLENNYSLNTVDICPVGALTSTDFRFKMRVWFLKPVKSICTESSAGCNTEVWSREGKIYRITPRRNDAVNDSWMPDSGRELYKQVEVDSRLTAYTDEGCPQLTDEVLADVAKSLAEGQVGVVGGAHLCVEEQWLLRGLLDAIPGQPEADLIAHTGEGDGILLTEDRTPNTRGALLTKLTSKLPQENLSALQERISKGEVKRLLVFGEDLTQYGFTRDELRGLEVVYCGTHHNDCSQLAKFEIPLLTVFERSGTFINQQFRVQKFHRAVPGPSGVLTTLTLLSRLTALITNEAAPAAQPGGVWRQMAPLVAAFKNLSWETIPDEGVVVDGSAYRDLPFVEGKSLHYDPAASSPAEAGTPA